MKFADVKIKPQTKFLYIYKKVKNRSWNHIILLFNFTCLICRPISPGVAPFSASLLMNTWEKHVFCYLCSDNTSTIWNLPKILENVVECKDLLKSILCMSSCCRLKWNSFKNSSFKTIKMIWNDHFWHPAGNPSGFVSTALISRFLFFDEK